MFNLSKHADFDVMVDEAAESIGGNIESPESSDISQDEAVGAIIESGPEADEKARVLRLQQDQELIGILGELKNRFPAEVEAINAFLSNQNSFRQLQGELAALPELTEQHNMEAITPQVSSFEGYKEKSNNVLNVVRRLNSVRREHERNQAPQGVAAFNLRQHKEAQMPQMPMPEAPMPQMPMPEAPMPQMPMPEEETGRFPVKNVGDFIDKFAEDLLAFNNDPGTQEYEKARIATEEIREAVSPGFEEEANSVLESIMQLDVTQRNTASDYLIKLYEVMIPPALTSDQAESQMEPVMSCKEQDAIQGIVRFSLTDSVLNNNKSAMIKTAADQFGQQYLLYGPTEKRICPKLRGKNLSVGDVVSEYTCRMHCIDGIVIDDNKTICGEALWRANAMDKYHSEYVDADGKTVGGYLNKRFEINRNIPEENRRRLKPGETRKPKPAAWGSTESRLQAMRAKEGQARGYRPDTNTGDPFEWCHDSDQNNVEVSQKERDRREEASGNKIVQYTNRDQGENNPKKAFNLSHFKTAQRDPYIDTPRPSAGSHDEYREKAIVNLMNRKKCPKCGDKVCRCGTGDAGDPKAKKEAQTPVAYAPQDTHQIAINPAAAGASPPSDIQSIKGQGFDGGKPMSAPSKPMSLEDMESVKYDFDAGQQKIAAMSDEAILWTIKDVKRTIDTQEQSSRTGASTPKLGYYNDELHTLMAEVRDNRSHLTEQVRQLLASKSVPGFNLSQFKKESFKVAETPHPHTVALPDHDYWRQNQPQDGHDPDVKPSKKKT